MITADLIIPALEATSKKQAFHAIAEATAAEFGGDPEVLFDALIDRERIGTTGIGNGVAIPHIKLPTVSRMYGVMARLEAPVDYDAIDNAPVDIIFMLLAPTDSKTTQHLKVLAHISRFLKDPDTCAAIRAKGCSENITCLMTEWAERQAASSAA
ncbi:MAG: transcriptional regulator [Alphaproteobacteria bacterium]|nr:transcriptional regulator [Alphaproteobacteria bacterium]